MELKRDEIIQGLRDNDSPYKSDQDNIRYAIAFINELTAKTEAQDIVITELRKCLDKANHDADRYARKIKELTEENERWKAIPEQVHKEMSEQMIEERKIERKLAVREMQKRLRAVAYQSGDWSHGEHPMVVELDDIDQIAEEMIGGNNADKED